MVEKIYRWGTSPYYTKEKDYNSPLGRGAFGSVYLCYKDNSTEEFAAKYMKINKTDPIYTYISKEIEALSVITQNKLKHGVQFYGKFDLPSSNPNEIQLVLIFELCKGKTLADVIQERAPLPEDDIRLLLQPLVECFQDLHFRFKMTHRDLKPENLLLKRPWMSPNVPELVLCDFGITTSAKIAQSRTGTALYMSPETHSGQPTTNAVDVFAFGVILYKMLYGFEPFSDKTASSWFHTGNIILPKKRRVSAECFDVLQRCLRIDAQQRPSFAQLSVHPFFTKATRHSLTTMFDGSDNYMQLNMHGPAYVYLPSPAGNLPAKDPIHIFNEYLITLTQ